MSYTDTDFEAPAAASHTPGPWHVGVKTYHAGRDVYGPKGESVAITDDVMTDIDEAKANARLIAAAPDLLEAAKLGLMALDDTAPDYAAIKAAIAKAEGRG